MRASKPETPFHAIKNLNGLEYLKLCARQKRGEILIYEVRTEREGYSVTFKDLTESKSIDDKFYAKETEFKF